MAQPEPSATEATILGLSEEYLKIVADLRDRLDNRFNRLPSDVTKSEGKPQQPNVLNEIIDNISLANAQLVEIMNFIAANVLPKIN